MGTFNFRTTDDDRPGGGVYKIPGNGPKWEIKQSDYPNVNLSGLTAENFFCSVVCTAGNSASVVPREYNNVNGYYGGGGKGRLSYTFSGGVGTVSVLGMSPRYASITKYMGDDQTSTSYGGFTYTLYMSRDKVI